jgi:hypothetical protein
MCLTFNLPFKTIRRFVFLSIEEIIIYEKGCVYIKRDMFSELDMNYFNILDLPNEILLIIFNKLNTIDVFCSVKDVNRRFYELSLNCCHVQDMQMTIMMDIDTCYKQISPIDNKLRRICRNILPKIHDKVHKLTVDQSSMIPVLHAANYPQLYSLTILDIQEEFLRDYLSSIVFLFLLLIIKKIINLIR